MILSVREKELKEEYYKHHRMVTTRHWTDDGVFWEDVCVYDGLKLIKICNNISSAKEYINFILKEKCENILLNSKPFTVYEYVFSHRQKKWSAMNTK